MVIGIALVRRHTKIIEANPLSFTFLHFVLACELLDWKSFESFWQRFSKKLDDLKDPINLNLYHLHRVQINENFMGWVQINENFMCWVDS